MAEHTEEEKLFLYDTKKRRRIWEYNNDPVMIAALQQQNPNNNNNIIQAANTQNDAPNFYDDGGYENDNEVEEQSNQSDDDNSGASDQSSEYGESNQQEAENLHSNMYENYVQNAQMYPENQNDDSDRASDSDYNPGNEGNHTQSELDENDNDFDTESSSNSDESVIDLEEFYNIGAVYNEIVSKIIDQGFQLQFEQLPKDHNKPFQLLISGAESEEFEGMTKQEFCQAHADTCAAANITYANSVKILENMRVFAGGSLNLPFSINPNTGNATCRLNSYLLPDSRDLEIHVCVNGCTAFILDFKELLCCPVCRANRYYPCQYGTCKLGIACDPFDPNTTIPHKESRNPQHVMYWRSIILKMLQMYKRSMEEDPSIFAHDANRHRTPGHATDLLDGEVPREQMTQMRAQHNFRAESFAIEHPGVVLHECSLVFSVFNDGDQLFKRKADSLWPMIGSIWNCDPSYRTKLGLGLFLIALHNLSVGSGAVQSLMDNVFAEELKALKNGVVFSFKRKNGNIHYVHLQARCVYYHLDTRAYEKMLHVQAAGAMAMCPKCDVGISGASRHIVNVRCYIGHSSFLAANHMLRFLGEKKNCNNLFVIPPINDGEYDSDDSVGGYGERVTKDSATTVDSAMYYGFRGTHYNSLIGKFLTELARSGEVTVENMNAAGKKIPYNSTTWDHCRVTDKKKYKKGRLPSNRSWVNHKFPYSDFAPALSYAVNNDVICTQNDVNHDQYCERGLRAKRERDKYEENCRVHNRKVNRKKKIKWKGVKGISLWAKVCAPLWQWLGFDLMHCAAVSTEYHLNTLCGNRGCDINSRLLSLCEGRFPFLQDAKIRPPWVASNYMQRLADSIHKCIMVPAQYKADYEFDFPLHHMSYLGSHDKLVFTTVFSTYFISFLDVMRPYKRYFMRYAEDLTRILNPCQCVASLPYLKDCVIETASVREGLFPDGEQQFMFHEKIHIARDLVKFGVVGGLMCFFGERCMHILGMGVPEGGLKYIKTTKERFVAKESAYNIIHNEYKKNAFRYTDNAGRYSVKVLKLIGKCEKVYLNNEVKTSLFDSLFEFMNTQVIDQINTKSAFMRIYDTYLTMQKKFVARTNHGVNRYINVRYLEMSEWVNELFVAYHKHREDFNITHIARLGYLINDVHDGDEEKGYLEEPNRLNELVDDGVLLHSDFCGILSDMALFGNASDYGVPIAAYTTCLNKGVEFRGRGAGYAEQAFNENRQSGTCNPMNLHFGICSITNPLNQFKTTWHRKNQIDSWCSITDYYMDGLVMRSAKYLGQSCYFFRINFPNDKLLHGLPFANTVLRRKAGVAISQGLRTVPTNYDANRDCWFLTPADSDYFHSHKQFISLTYVDATSYALSALNIPDTITTIANIQPLKYPRPPDKVDKWPLIIYDGPSTDLSRVYFLPLHPERLISIQYASIENDDDGVKIFEKQTPKFYQRGRKKNRS